MQRKLTDTAVKNAKPKPDKRADGGGLYLLATNTGKYWRHDYRYDGKRKTITYGVYPDVSLADARREHEWSRQCLADGDDPKVARDWAKPEAIKHNTNTFGAVSGQWREYKEPDWSESHIKSVRRILKNDVLPWLGNRPVNEIEPPELLQVLRRMEKRVGDSTRKAQQIIGQIFRYGVYKGFCQRGPTRQGGAWAGRSRTTQRLLRL